MKEVRLVQTNELFKLFTDTACQVTIVGLVQSYLNGNFNNFNFIQPNTTDIKL